MSQQINLFNENSRKRGVTFSMQNMAQSLGAILVCLILLFVYTNYRANQEAKKVEETKNSVTAEQQRLATLTAEFSKQREGVSIDQELKNVTAELTAQHEIIDALKSGVIGNTKGYSQYMQAFARQMVNGLWLTGFSIEGDAMQMSINGATLSPELVPGYILRLNNEQVMRGKTFNSLQMKLPKEEADKKATGQYLEFVLQSLSESEAKN